MARRLLSSFRTRKFEFSRSGQSASTTFGKGIHHDDEKPTPVVLLAGEGFTEDVWSRYSERLAFSGYSGFIFAPNHGHEGSSVITIDEVADALNTAIQSFKMTPPVLVGHSFSSLVAQRYLESYPASGLCMINPIPPQPANVLKRLKTSLLYRSGAVQRLHYLKAHYNLTITDTELKKCMQQEVFNGTAPKFPSYVENLLRAEKGMGGDFEINVEPSCCPILSVVTTGDRLVHDDDIQAIASYYGLDKDSQKVLECASRAPMIGGGDNSNIDNLHDIIMDWIDDRI